MHWKAVQVPHSWISLNKLSVYLSVHSKGEMNIPAYTAPTLCIGRTYDARNTTAGIDIFPADNPTKTINVNQFTFKYKVIRNSSDVKDLLNISGELSLRVKAGLVKVEGSGKYLSDTANKEGTTELLAVLKCVTVRSFQGNQTSSVYLVDCLRIACLDWFDLFSTGDADFPFVSGRYHHR